MCTVPPCGRPFPLSVFCDKPMANNVGVGLSGAIPSNLTRCGPLRIAEALAHAGDSSTMPPALHLSRRLRRRESAPPGLPPCKHLTIAFPCLHRHGAFWTLCTLFVPSALISPVMPGGPPSAHLCCCGCCSWGWCYGLRLKSSQTETTLGGFFSTRPECHQWESRRLQWSWDPARQAELMCQPW